METGKNSGLDGLSLEGLEAELRQMPAPQAPAELEARLLADIAAAKRAPRVWYRAALFPSAAAATIIAAVILGFIFLGGGSSLTLAEVQEAVAEESWLHIKYDNGREWWVSLRDGKKYYKREGGEIVFVDSINNIRYRYYGPGSKVMRQDEPIITTKTPPLKLEVRTPWEYTLGFAEKLLDKAHEIHRAERYEEKIEGKLMVRFDFYYKTPQDKWLLRQQIWANPKTRLPVRVRERLHSRESKQQNREWITGVYEFPNRGPSSIYDLGVPRDIEILKARGKPTPHVQEVLHAIDRVRQQFPDMFRAIVWDEEERAGHIRIVYRDRATYRSEVYMYLGPDLVPEDYRLLMPATPEKILEWTQTRVPESIEILKGGKSYRRFNGHTQTRTRIKVEPTTRVLRQDNGSFYRRHKSPYIMLWPISIGSNAEILDNTSEAPTDCITVRSLSVSTHFGGTPEEMPKTYKARSDYYLDPSKDYLCAKEVRWIYRAEGWVRQSEAHLCDFVRLPGGQWYARKHVRINFAEGPEATPTVSKYVSNIDVKLLKDDEFPEGIFDGQKLLEGAKLETY